MAYRARALADANKKHATPSLDYQLTGPVLQHSFKWQTFPRDRESCPVCEDCYTMRVQTVENLEKVNAEANCAAATSAKKKVLPVKSARHGCYCLQFDCRGNIDSEGVSCVRSMRQRNYRP